MVMLIMTIFFHEKFSIITASSVLLAIAGVALLGSGGGDDGGSLDPLGVGLLLASALCNALYISGLHVARIHSISGLSITFWVLFFGTGVSLVNALISGTFEIIGTWEQLALSLLLAIITAVISNLTLILVSSASVPPGLHPGRGRTAHRRHRGHPRLRRARHLRRLQRRGRHLRRRGPGHDRAADPGLAAEKSMGVDTRGEGHLFGHLSPSNSPSPCPNVSGSVAVLMARKPVSCRPSPTALPVGLHAPISPAIPIPGHGVPYAPGSRTHDAYGCPWAPSHAASLPAVAEACFLPSPLSRPLPSRHRSLS